VFAGILVLAGMAARFTPPSPEERAVALGPTAELPEVLRRALDSDRDFQPIRAPGPDDWLANHPELGQTYGQFVHSQPNRPEALRRVLYLQPLGTFDDPDSPKLEDLRRFAAAFFMLDARLLPPLALGDKEITTRRNPWSGNSQMLTTDILRLLQRRLPKDAFALVGITMTDLYPEPSWNFVFGQASLQERVGVYSFARYSLRFQGASPAGAQKLVLRRSLKVLAHETGHMYGLQHCIWYECLMNGSNHLQEADARPLHLCPVDLRKLQWSIGFDVVERYRGLRDFYRQAGFEDEAAWLDRRIRFLESNRAGGKMP